MSKGSSVSLSITEAPPRQQRFPRLVRVFLGRGLVIFGLVFVLLFLAMAAFAPLSPL
jgi:hypothetical protein